MVDPEEVMVMVMARGKLILVEDMVDTAAVDMVVTAAVDMEALEEDMVEATLV